MQVTAKVTHIQPGSLVYRTEGEQFEHDGPYEYVEEVKAEPSEEDAASTRRRKGKAKTEDE